MEGQAEWEHIKCWINFTAPFSHIWFHWWYLECYLWYRQWKYKWICIINTSEVSTMRTYHQSALDISEISTFPIVVIFFRGCVSEMVVLSYSVIYYIYIPGTLGPCFHYWCSVYGICKWSDTLWPVGRVRLFADYTISLSSLCRLIWKHWTTKMLVRYMMLSVCLRLRQFSQLSLYSLYGAVCLQLTQFSCDDRENVYFILLSSSNRKYESLTIV